MAVLISSVQPLMNVSFALTVFSFEGLKSIGNT